MTTPDQEGQTDDTVAQMEFSTFVRFVIPRGMHSKYAQHLMVQPGEHEVTFSFFEVVMPPLFGTPEVQATIQKQIQETGIPAECVARVVIPLARFPDFVKAIQGVLEKITIQAGDGDTSHAANPNDAQPNRDRTENS